MKITIKTTLRERIFKAHLLFKNKKLLSGDRAAVEQDFMNGGKSPASVREMMKQQAARQKGEDPKTKLEREKSRLEKTIAQLTQRLEYVEESLASL